MTTGNKEFTIDFPATVNKTYVSRLSDDESLIYDTNAYPQGVYRIGIRSTDRQCDSVAYLADGRLTLANVLYSNGHSPTTHPLGDDNGFSEDLELAGLGQGLLERLLSYQERFLTSDNGLPRTDVAEYIRPIYERLYALQRLVGTSQE